MEMKHLLTMNILPDLSFNSGDVNLMIATRESMRQALESYIGQPDTELTRRNIEITRQGFQRGNR
jgi:hypothetical protein